MPHARVRVETILKHFDLSSMASTCSLIFVLPWTLLDGMCLIYLLMPADFASVHRIDKILGFRYPPYNASLSKYAFSIFMLTISSSRLKSRPWSALYAQVCLLDPLVPQSQKWVGALLWLNGSVSCWHLFSLEVWWSVDLRLFEYIWILHDLEDLESKYPTTQVWRSIRMMTGTEEQFFVFRIDSMYTVFHTLCSYWMYWTSTARRCQNHWTYLRSVPR